MRFIKPYMALLSVLFLLLPAASCGTKAPMDNPAVIRTDEIVSPGENYPDDGILPSQEGVDEETDDFFRIAYTEVAQNNRLVLYADTDKGFFALKNKKSGKIWYSTPKDSLLDPKTKGKLKQSLQSQIVLNYLFREDENTNKNLDDINSQAGCINRGEIKVTRIENGIRAEYRFSEIGVTVPVEYTLGADWLSARIDLEKLDEGTQVLLTSVHLLPAMGAGNWEEEGYLFVPDGSGAIINFNNNVNMNTNYTAPVYGPDLGVVQYTMSPRSQIVHLPVFGTVTGNDALMGVIAQGDGSSEIYVYNGKENTGYNAVSSRAVLRSSSVVESLYETNHQTNIRQVSHTPYTYTSYEVRYYVLDGENASCAGMAARYRAYLEGRGMQKSKGETLLAVDFIGAVDLKANFLGISYNKLHTLTTFTQARDILTELKNRGADSVSARFSGWSENGYLNEKIPGKASALNSLGGKKAFSDLSDYCANNGVPMYPEVDFVRFRKGGNGVNGLFDAAKTPSGSDALQFEYMLSVFERKTSEKPVKLLRTDKLLSVAEAYLPSYKKSGLKNIAMGFIGNGAYSDFRKDGGVHRGDQTDIYEQVMQSLRKADTEVAVTGANAYTLPYAGRIFEAPVCSSGYDVFTHDVPFYQMVLKGYIPMTVPKIVQSAEPEVTFLKAVETGTGLLYACTAESSGIFANSRYDGLYGSTFELWAEDAAARCGEYGGLFNRIAGKTINGHNIMENGLTVTTFEGGIRVAVNYNKTDRTVNGRTVKAMGFLDWEAE